MPKVSVIIPVYNVEKYLRECLDTVINQTLKDIEIICINDGSTDNSLNILKEYAQKDDRFIIHTQENMGTGIARNKGIDLAKGEYIQFIDPDDWVELDMLERLYEFAKVNDSKIIKFNYKEYNDFSKKITNRDFKEFVKKKYHYDLVKFPYYSWKELKNNCLWHLDLHTPMHIYSTEFVKSNNIKFAPNKYGEDHIFANATMLLAERIDFLDAYLYYYRIRSESSIHKIDDDNFCVFENIKLLKEFLIEHGLFEELKEEWFKYLKNSLCLHYKCVTDDSKKRFENLCQQYFTSKCEYKRFISHLKSKRSFVENIFSIKNKDINAVKHKVITILGLEIKKRIKPKHIVNCYYFQAVPNFGDLLNISLFKMFGLNIKAGDIKNGQIVAIGSLLQTLFKKESFLSFVKKLQLKLRRPMLVYGSGFIEDIPSNFFPLRKLKIVAVRGYSSLEKLKKFKNKNIIIPQHVVIGDPGLLSKYLVDVSNIEKKYDLGIIPHYVDKKHMLLNKIQVSNSTIIDIQQEPEIFIKKIAECKNIISSAMHGLIAADSLGIPNVRMVVSNKITGGDYKYNDYYSAFGLKQHNVINLSERTFTDGDIANIALNYNIKQEQVNKICEDLIKNFPYKEKMTKINAINKYEIIEG